MKFRIKHMEGIGFYAQVKKKWFSGWGKIGKHTIGYGIYPEDDINHPMESEKEAEKRIEEYKDWLKLSNKKPKYLTRQA